MTVESLMQKKVVVRCHITPQYIFHHYSPVYSSVIDPTARFSEQEDRTALPESRLDPGLVTEKLINRIKS